MVDWKNIHPDFTPELQKEWEERGVTYEDCKSLIGFGFQPQEVELACYLSECQEYEPEEDEDKNNEKIKRYIETTRIEYLKWKGLGFDLETIMSWKKQGSTPEQTQEWLNIGLTPQDDYFCAWLKNSKQLTAEQVLGNERQLREEYNKTPQGWLDQNYPDKEEKEEIYINQQLEGVLDCSGYDKLYQISISLQVDSSKFEIKKGSGTKIIHCIHAQEWLDKNYPKKGICIRENEKSGYASGNINNYNKTRTQITELDIRWKNLEDSLDLSDFTNLEELGCKGNKLTSLNVSNCNKLREINCHKNQLTNLDLSNLNQLNKLNCPNNHLTQIPYLPNPEQLTELDIFINNFSQDLSIFSQFKNLEELKIDNNHFTGSLKPLKDLTKLKTLSISNTDLNSGAEYLPDSLERIGYYTKSKIKNQLDQHFWLDIHKDFIGEFGEIYKTSWLDQGFNKEQTKKILEEWNKDSELIRPQEDAKFLNWFLNFKKLDLTWALENEEEFKDLRDNHYYFGTCEECQQPNTSKNWCQSCNAKHFKDNFSNWTSGNLNIDNFIQQCQSEATSPWNVLEWIPYKQITNIKHIANGGFGKVEKAEWKDGAIESWNSWNKNWGRKKEFQKNYKTVALKTLTNSQNLNQNFLQELTLYKMFRSSVSNMVPCYGVSKNKEGNYILVMEFMKEGNLKEFLKRNYQELTFFGEYGVNSKLNFLKQITQGLKDIHRKHLVHRDFHSGNVIVDGSECRITDLGLSKPADEVDKDKVFGVMPYVAPEVLLEKPYTQASDIYSLGIIAYEILTCLPPYVEQSHDVNLALKIIRGERPQFPPQLKYPQLVVDLIERCWDSEPNNRPTAREIKEKLDNEEIYQQIQETEEHNKTLPQEIRYPKYQDNNILHSTPINTKQILEKVKEQWASKDFTLDNFFNQPTTQEDPQEQSSHQAQIEAPPKK